jgi:Tfp pilus assembly PilM family ATPase
MINGAGGGEDLAKPLFGSTRREDVNRAVFDAARPVMQELAKEIGLCLRYYGVTFRGNRPECVTLCGGEARDKSLAEVIREQLDMPVEIAEPLSGVDISAEELMIDRRGSMPEWTVAAGVALRNAAVETLTRGAA